MLNALPLIPALAALPAHAAEAFEPEATALPPRMGGDVEIRYEADGESARLVQDGEEVGRRVLADHRIVLEGAFSPLRGLAVFVAIPASTGEVVRYPEAHEMVVDADFGSGGDAGTMLGTDALDPAPELRGSGLEGTWFGLRGAPFHRTLHDRGDRTSWWMEAAWRFRDRTNFWTVGESGRRGAGPGAAALRLRLAWSTAYRASHPYLRATLLRSSRITTDVVDESGTTLARGLVLRPRSEAGLVVGSELLAGSWGEGESAGHVAVDLHLDFGYRSWQDVPSGTYLPDVLDMSRSIAVTEGECLYLRGGLGVNWRIVRAVELDVGGSFGTSSPRRVEHPYPVSTGMGTMEWGAFARLRYRARPREEPPPAEPEPEPAG